MTAQIIDGKAVAESLRAEMKLKVDALRAEKGYVPGLAVVLVGEDPASKVYVGSKVKATAEVGFKGFEFRLDASASEAEVLAVVEQLNANPEVHGILVQLPLPKHINTDLVLATIVPEKDVDGFHPVNAGRLSVGLPSFVPCTPRGSQILIDRVMPDISGANAVVIGRSNIVGKPMAQLLLQRNATVTIAHSRTKDLPGVCAAADILVAAVGRPEMVRGNWIKPGAIVIDVGINRIQTPEGKSKLVGDVHFAEAMEVAGYITPVPGGVGPMTICCLLMNAYDAAVRIGA